MSIVANDVDTRMKSIRISDSRSNHSSHTLKEELLKDASKYSCIVKSLFTNSVPPILVEDTVLLAILPKDAIGQPFNYTVADLRDVVIGAPYEAYSKLILQRGHHYNILQVIQYISTFVDNFNTRIAVHGVNLGIVGGVLIPAKVQNLLVAHDLSEFEPDRHVGFSIDSSGRGQFYCSESFLSNFFFFINPDFAKLVGLTQFLFGGSLLGAFVTSDTEDIREEDANFDPQNPAYVFQWEPSYVHVPPGLGLTFKSDYPFFLLDQRLSLDVELTIPVSRIINVVNGEYTEKFRLASFLIDNYINTNSKITTVDGIARPSIRVRDTLQGV